MHRKLGAAVRREIDTSRLDPDALARRSAVLNSRDEHAVFAGIPSWHPRNEVTTRTPQDKLKEIEAELAAERSRRPALVSARDDARQAFANTEGLSQDTDEFRSAQDAVAALGTCDDRIAELTAMQVATLKLMGEHPAVQGHDRPSGDPTDPRASGWNAASLLEGESVQQFLAAAANSASRFGRQELGEVASRDAMVADVTGTTNMRRGEWAGVLPQLRRPLSVLDLLPTGTMDSNTFPYTRESGAFTGATETTEGQAKPEAGITFTDDEATARTIAAWLKLQKQSLADTPALRSIIESRLRYLVLRRLEAQILSGDGNAPNLRGILNTSGLGAVTFASGALVPDQILKGLTTVLLADAQATGALINPIDWQTALLAKASGDGHYFSGGPFEVTPQQMWGVPLIPSPAIAQGTALVGDWQIGAMLLIREGVHVLLSDSDQDDFTKNKVTLLGEMRAALPVFRPAAFTTVALQ